MTDYKMKAPFTPAPLNQKIYHMKALQVSDVRFEWHPISGQVYYVFIGSNPEIAERMCTTQTEEQAKKAVQVWCSGYEVGKARFFGPR